jgi:hypothetical protein
MGNPTIDLRRSTIEKSTINDGPWMMDEYGWQGEYATMSLRGGPAAHFRRDDEAISFFLETG